MELGDNLRVTDTPDKLIGIVDPFLKEAVSEGQRFFMFLYPGSITSLKHNWTHPAFLPGNGTAPSPMIPAEQWLRMFADQVKMSYGGLLEATEEWLQYGDGVTLGFDTPDICYDQMQKFWHNYEIVTGKEVPPNKATGFFSCAC